MKDKIGKWAVGAGNFLFHYRNILFPAYMVALLVFARPHPLFSTSGIIAHIWLTAGAFFAVLGECIRLGTIGFRYIERGGKNRQVYASRLVSEGVFSHVRNPMYVGNILIAAGLSMLTGSPRTALFSTILFIVIYRLIISAEENFLHQEFGAEFEAYCKSTNRFYPRFKGLYATLQSIPFEWGRIFRKDYGNITSIAIIMTILPLWRRYFLETGESFQEGHVLHERIENAGWIMVVIGVFYITTWAMKKRGYLNDKHSAAQ